VAGSGSDSPSESDAEEGRVTAFFFFFIVAGFGNVSGDVLLHTT
jgi:hypothetical protein